MARTFLFVVDPLPTLNPRTDTSLAIMEEACSRGATTYVCGIKDLVLDGGKLAVLARPIVVPQGYTKPQEATTKATLIDAGTFDAIFMRKDPPVDQAFISALLMLRHFDRERTVMINHPDGLLRANEKLFGLSCAPQLFAETLVAHDHDTIRDFARQHEMVAIKPLFASGGAGILMLRHDDRNFTSALELLTDSFNRPIMVQKYIENAREGDKRIIVLGGKPMGAIMRKPCDGDHRANFHAGGSGHRTEITERDREIVATIAPHLQDLGLHLVGIDVLGGYLTEINVTSPTCVIEIEQFQSPSEARLRATIVDYVEELLA